MSLMRKCESEDESSNARPGNVNYDSDEHVVSSGILFEHFPQNLQLA